MKWITKADGRLVYIFCLLFCLLFFYKTVVNLEDREYASVSIVPSIAFKKHEDKANNDEKYELYITDNYVATEHALAPKGSHNSNNIGAFAGLPHLDTACPLTSKTRLSSNRIQRWPDAISIGFPKCGTSALSFLDCHSKFVIRDSEPYFWNNRERISSGLSEYAIPEASIDEILIEKTPDYVLGNYVTLKFMADEMKTTISNLKLIVVLCDPALRAFSHIKMQATVTPDLFKQKWEGRDEISAIKLLGEYLDPNKRASEKPERLSTMDDIIRFGQYNTQIQPFLEIFDKSDILFLDGGGIISDPEVEFSKMENFFNVKNELEFQFNSTKGLPCLKRPVPMCLGSGKGNTRQQNSTTMKPDEVVPQQMSMIREYYRTEMLQLYKLVHEHLLPEEFCLSPKTYRFTWLSAFVCPGILLLPEQTPIIIKEPIATKPTAKEQSEAKDKLLNLAYLKQTFVKTGNAVPPKGSKNKNNIGAFASLPHLNTACPLTSKYRLSLPLQQRWPDAIGIGFPKCGTSATSFIDCHPKFVYRDGEPYFWTDRTKMESGLSEYPLPEAAVDEILIEKTPDYSLGGAATLKYRAEQIQKHIPNVKLIVYLCDPAQRAFSHIKMQSRRTPDRFDKIWEHHDEMSAIRVLGEYLNQDESINTKPKKLPAMDVIITYGEYYEQLKPYMETFNISNFHFVDGGGIVENPAREFMEFEDFFGVEHELEFKFNSTKGYPCLTRPVPMCLGKDKGHTRNEKETLSPDDVAPKEMKMIRDYYKPQMSKMFHIVHPSVTQNAFCSNSEQYRFSWLARFICEQSDLILPSKINTNDATEDNDPSEENDQSKKNIDMSEAEYTLHLANNYVKTEKAHGYPEARNPNNIGAYADWVHLDTSCPLTIKSRLNKTLVHRWPDAIGIGFPKCGTSVMDFIDCHPKLVFRSSEPYYWASTKAIEGGLVEYAIPKASTDEILIEKTPDYSLGGYQVLSNRATAIKKSIPNVKLLVFICDPALRAYSHIKMQSRKTPDRFNNIWGGNDEITSLKLLGEFLDVAKPAEQRSPRLPGMQTIIEYGQYATHLKPYLEQFNISNIHFVDGGNVIKNPNTEFSMLETFFKVENVMNFTMNEEKGYPCLHRPVPMCLNADKGHTRGNGSLPPDDAIPVQMKMIRMYYKPEMLQIFQLVHPKMLLSTFCASVETYRFAWLARFICT